VAQWWWWKFFLFPFSFSLQSFAMPKVKHIVLIKFKASVAPEQIDDLFNQLLDLTENVDGIEDYVSGPNSSPEGLNKGFTHALIMSFHDSAARDAYLAHPEHEKVKTTFLPLIDDIVVFDFEV
jgi:hypothetical protein